MARHAVINPDNKVVNIIVWEGANWSPPRDHVVVNISNMECHIGDKYNPITNTFIRQS